MALRSHIPLSFTLFEYILRPDGSSDPSCLWLVTLGLLVSSTLWLLRGGRDKGVVQKHSFLRNDLRCEAIKILF